MSLSTSPILAAAASNDLQGIRWLIEREGVPVDLMGDLRARPRTPHPPRPPTGAPWSIFNPPSSSALFSFFVVDAKSFARVVIFRHPPEPARASDRSDRSSHPKNETRNTHRLTAPDPHMRIRYVPETRGAGRIWSANDARLS